MPPTFDEACGLLLLNDAITFKDATETLFKILQNVVLHPGEGKFRTLQRSSAGFASKLAGAKGAVRFLKACGFEEQGGSGDAGSLVLPPGSQNDQQIAAGKAALKALVGRHTEQIVRVADEERRKANEAAAQKLVDLRELSKRNTATRDAAHEEERQRLLSGIHTDKNEENKWRQVPRAHAIRTRGVSDDGV